MIDKELAALIDETTAIVEELFWSNEPFFRIVYECINMKLERAVIDGDVATLRTIVVGLRKLR